MNNIKMKRVSDMTDPVTNEIFIENEYRKRQIDKRQIDADNIKKYQPEEGFIYFLSGKGGIKKYRLNSTETKIQLIPYHFLPLAKPIPLP